LPDETKEEQELTKDYLITKSLSYFDIERSETDGPVRINKAVEMQEDVYAVAFIYQLKRNYIEEDLSEMEEEHEALEKKGITIEEKEKD